MTSVVAESRVAVVTGAGSGIGRAVAQRLVGDGLTVGLLDVDVDGMATTAATLPAGATFATQRCNVADATDVRRAVDACFAEFGRIDVVVTAAGIFRTGPLLEMEAAEFDAMLGVNVTGTFLTVQAAGRHLVSGGRGGRVVCISSEAAVVTGEQVWAYSAGKAAIDLMVRGWAQELGPHGVTVNTVAPGLIDTPLAMRQAGSEGGPLRRAAAHGRAVRRIGRPDEIASLVAFLCSDEAGYLTGAFMLADGGARDRHLHPAPDADARAEYRTIAGDWKDHDSRQRRLMEPGGGSDAG